MNSDVVIKVDSLSKRYRLLKQGNTRFSLREALMSPIKNIREIAQLTGKSESSDLEEEGYFWALKDISFEVKQGEIIGIVGRNGAGKTTLLKILSKITCPTSGRVVINGRVNSLLAVGTGFNQELTGRENIYMNGTIHGMSRKEITKKFDEIVDFSGVEKFIDMPIKRYSSGMTVRLGFAVAAFLEPEILIVDEVLAVGDMDFQKKCIGKMNDVTKQGRTVLFVSHNMPIVRNLCTRGIFLSQGSLDFDGSVDESIDHYMGYNSEEELQPVWESEMLREFIEGKVDKQKSFIELERITVMNNRKEPCVNFDSSEIVLIKFEFEIKMKPGDFRIVISVLNRHNEAVLSTQISDKKVHIGSLENGKYCAYCEFPGNTFGSNLYMLRTEFLYVKKEHLVLNSCPRFRVTYDQSRYNYGTWESSYLRPDLDWKIEKI